MIVLSEMQQSSSGAKTRHDFSLTFDDAVAQLLSPSAFIVVWCVTSAGEIVSDSLEVNVDAVFKNEVSAFICLLYTSPSPRDS